MHRGQEKHEDTKQGYIANDRRCNDQNKNDKGRKQLSTKHYTENKRRIP
jgi:hypothetical protein